MADYEELINKVKSEDIPHISPGLWYRIEETLIKKEHALHIPAPLKTHPFLSSSLAFAAAFILLFSSIGFYRDIQLDNYLAGQMNDLRSAEAFFNYLETF